MRMIFIWLMSSVLLLGLLPSIRTLAQPSPENHLFSSEDGLVSLRVPAEWYQTSSSDENRVVLIAAETPEAAADPQAMNELVVYLSIENQITEGVAELLDKTLQEHGLSEPEFTKSAVAVMGLPGTRYDMQFENLQSTLAIFHLPQTNQWVHFFAAAQADHWQNDLVEKMLANLLILPQQSTTPKGWAATIRAPQGWRLSAFSSFTQWIAPEDSPFAGTEIWFQAGFRTDLIGQGEAPFVLRSLGINYTSQVDEASSYQTFLGGLPAVALPFESFTHTGISYHVQGTTDFGTANLIARAPLGEWTPAHQTLVEAMLTSVQITPPTADAAPVGLRPGYRAPDFSGEIVGEGNFSLADYKGKLVFVHFWFVDCPYCREEWPRLQAVYDEYKDRGMVLLAINGIDPLSYIESYTQAEGLDFPLVLDEGTLHDLFGVTAFPTTFIIGPDGVILRAARGPMSDLTLRQLTEEYLGE
jgi:peroxiredoxin